jgi:catechol 2,3-dioxygenase-like lactoylglutathione lyase family enzyme
MKQRIANITLVVRDYDEAIAFYTEKLNFDLVEDTPLTPTKRWVLVAPKGSNETRLLLAQADGPVQEAAIGFQTGGRVSFFLFTDDVWRDFHQMQTQGVKFIREPVEQPYGTVAVFEDLYGNQWDLLQPAN